jgi:hypothetical protein
MMHSYKYLKENLSEFAILSIYTKRQNLCLSGNPDNMCRGCLKNDIGFGKGSMHRGQPMSEGEAHQIKNNLLSLTIANIG